MTVPDLEALGIWLFVFGIAVIVVELVLAGLWTMRLTPRSRALSQRLAAEQALVREDIERLRVTLAETQALWQPYRRLLRLLRHPLTIALVQSFARRWAE